MEQDHIKSELDKMKTLDWTNLVVRIQDNG